MALSERGKWWSYRREDGVGIWEIDDWEKLFEEELADAEEHYRETASQSDMTAALVVFDEVDALSSEMQDHMTDSIYCSCLPV